MNTFNTQRHDEILSYKTQGQITLQNSENKLLSRFSTTLRTTLSSALAEEINVRYCVRGSSYLYRVDGQLLNHHELYLETAQTAPPNHWK